MFCESSRWCPEGSLCASPRWPTGEASGLTNLCTEDRGLNSQWCDLGLSPTRIRDFRWPEQGAERRGGGGVGGRGGQRQKRKTLIRFRSGAVAGRHASGVRVFVLYGPLFGGCSFHYSIIMGPKTVFELFASAPAEAVRGSYTDSLNSPSFIPVPRNPTPVLDGFESRPKILKVTKYRASMQGTCAEAIPCTL